MSAKNLILFTLAAAAAFVIAKKFMGRKDKYGATVGSQQDKMLAEQEAGL